MLGFSLLGDFFFLIPLSVVSAEVEMTSYALLTYTLLGDVASALPVVKWLSQQRNALGGFSSTQVGCLWKRKLGCMHCQLIQECRVSIFLAEIVCVLLRRKTPQCSLLLPPWTGNLKGTQTLSSQVPLIGKVSKT